MCVFCVGYGSVLSVDACVRVGVVLVVVCVGVGGDEGAGGARLRRAVGVGGWVAEICLVRVLVLGVCFCGAVGRGVPGSVTLSFFFF